MSKASILRKVFFGGRIFRWGFIRVGLKAGWIFCQNQNKTIFLASKPLIFKTSKLLKSNQMKYLLVSLHNRMTLFEARVTGSPRDSPERKWVPGEGLKHRVHIKCMEDSTKKAICAKKLKRLNNFFNTLQLFILRSNINRKALKRLLFFDPVIFQQS